MNSVLLRQGQLVTMNSTRETFTGDLRIRDGKIVALGRQLAPEADEEIVDVSGSFVIPGLIQAHTHLCQTLFRGLADDLELLDWLQQRIWPLENAHDEPSLRASAQVGLLEMQLSGTTSILDMGTVRHHHVVFVEAQRSGMRYWGGNCMMDQKRTSGPLYRPTEETLDYCRELIRDWHNKTSRLQYVISPRFVISCTERLLKASAKLRQEHGLLFHTHASENKKEVELVRKRTGLDNVKYLKKVGCLSAETVLAHGIHLSASEVQDMVRTRAGLAHCPSSNLKLASGLARITTYRRKGMKVALGSDGAPCNNRMDAFTEMRLAALLQKPLFGPTALPALEAFELATVGGAQVLNATESIGSLEIGKRADIAIVDRSHPSVATVEDPYSALVYSCSGRDVTDVWIDGQPIVRGRQHRIYNQPAVLSNAREELQKLKRRIRL
ncbi:MAG: amidohydrolase family protein [Bdellovibrionales bacterium]